MELIDAYDDDELVGQIAHDPVKSSG